MIIGTILPRFPTTAHEFKEEMGTGMAEASAPRIGIVMGSQSDWPTMKLAADILDKLGVSHETKIVSAHRTPDRLVEYGANVTAFVYGSSVVGTNRNNVKNITHQLGNIRIIGGDVGCADTIQLIKEIRTK